MITIAELAAFDKQREEMDRKMAAIGRRFAAEQEKFISRDAYFDSWEFFPITKNIAIQFEETWQGGSERTTVMIPFDEFEKMAQPA